MIENQSNFIFISNRREVSYEEGKYWMETNGLNLFFETSSKTRENVDEV